MSRKKRLMYSIFGGFMTGIVVVGLVLVVFDAFFGD